MIILIKNNEILKRFEPDIKRLIGKMIDKIDYRHSVDEMVQVFRDKLLFSSMLIFLSLNDRYSVTGVAVVETGQDIFGVNSAHIDFGSYEGKCLKEDIRELMYILKSNGIENVSYTTKRNGKAMNKRLGVLNTEYVGSVYKFKI